MSTRGVVRRVTTAPTFGARTTTNAITMTVDAEGISAATRTMAIQVIATRFRVRRTRFIMAACDTGDEKTVPDHRFLALARARFASVARERGSSSSASDAIAFSFRPIACDSPAVETGRAKPSVLVLRERHRQHDIAVDSGGEVRRQTHRIDYGSALRQTRGVFIVSTIAPVRECHTTLGLHLLLGSGRKTRGRGRKLPQSRSGGKPPHSYSARATARTILRLIPTRIGSMSQFSCSL